MLSLFRVSAVEHTYTHACTHACTHTHTHTLIHTHTAYPCMYTSMHMHTHTHTPHTHKHTHSCMHTHTCTHCVYTCMFYAQAHTHAHTHKHTLISYLKSFTLSQLQCPLGAVIQNQEAGRSRHPDRQRPMPEGGDIVSNIQSTQKEAVRDVCLVSSMHTARANNNQGDVKK